MFSSLEKKLGIYDLGKGEHPFPMETMFQEASSTIQREKNLGKILKLQMVKKKVIIGTDLPSLTPTSKKKKEIKDSISHLGHTYLLAERGKCNVIKGIL